MNSKTLLKPLALALAAFVPLAVPVRAEEGGAGHYMPGSAASFIDAFPGKPGAFAALNFFTYYEASAGRSTPLPLGGFVTAGIDAKAVADTLGGFYQTPWQVLGGGYAAGLAVPYIWMEVETASRTIMSGSSSRSRFE